jgi:hypothetical protein
VKLLALHVYYYLFGFHMGKWKITPVNDRLKGR